MRPRLCSNKKPSPCLARGPDAELVLQPRRRSWAHGGIARSGDSNCVSVCETGRHILNLLNREKSGGLSHVVNDDRQSNVGAAALLKAQFVSAKCDEARNGW